MIGAHAPCPPGRAARPGAKGFTLVELLVALALMGMAAALILQGLQMAGTVSLRQRGSSSDLEDIVGAQRLIRARIERMSTVIRLDSALPIVDARGSASDFRFIAPALDRSSPAALDRYLLTRTAGGDLVLYSVSTRDGAIDRNGVDLANWLPVTLLRDTAGLSIDYFGIDDAGRMRWQERWWDRPQPPALVRIRVGFPSGDRRRWPDLMIRPRATMDTSCKPDALTGRCGRTS